jgi:glucose/arabinose dehydrogenase
MVLHPHFNTSPFVYLVYTYYNAKGDFLEKIVRYTYNGSTLVSPLTLVDGILAEDRAPYMMNGSRLAIGADMKLYATTGDAVYRSGLPQNPGSLNGKVLRVNLDGSIPSDNPYGNAVWSIGHRNPQGLVFGLGRLYSSEHGETSDDELNIIERGRNYGWSAVEGFCDLTAEQAFCTANNVKEPIYAWTPTVAPSGIDYYDHKEIPQWKRSLLVAFLKDRKLRQMKLNASGTEIISVREYFINQFGRLRDIAISPEGKVYLCTDDRGTNQDMIIEVSRGE